MKEPHDEMSPITGGNFDLIAAAAKLHENNFDYSIASNILAASVQSATKTPRVNERSNGDPFLFMNTRMMKEKKKFNAEVSDYLVVEVLKRKELLIENNTSRDLTFSESKRNAWNDVRSLLMKKFPYFDLNVEAIKSHWRYRKRKVTDAYQEIKGGEYENRIQSKMSKIDFGIFQMLKESNMLEKYSKSDNSTASPSEGEDQMQENASVAIEAIEESIAIASPSIFSQQQQNMNQQLQQMLQAHQQQQQKSAFHSNNLQFQQQINGFLNSTNLRHHHQQQQSGSPTNFGDFYPPPSTINNFNATLMELILLHHHQQQQKKFQEQKQGPDSPYKNNNFIDNDATKHFLNTFDNNFNILTIPKNDLNSKVMSMGGEMKYNILFPNDNINNTDKQIADNVVNNTDYNNNTNDNKNAADVDLNGECNDNPTLNNIQKYFEEFGNSAIICSEILERTLKSQFTFSLTSTTINDIEKERPNKKRRLSDLEAPICCDEATTSTSEQKQETEKQPSNEELIEKMNAFSLEDWQKMSLIAQTDAFYAQRDAFHEMKSAFSKLKQVIPQSEFFDRLIALLANTTKNPLNVENTTMDEDKVKDNDGSNNIDDNSDHDDENKLIIDDNEAPDLDLQLQSLSSLSSQKVENSDLINSQC